MWWIQQGPSLMWWIQQGPSLQGTEGLADEMRSVDKQPFQKIKMDKGLRRGAEKIVIITIAVIYRIPVMGQVLSMCPLISLRGVGIIIPIPMRKWRFREWKWLGRHHTTSRNPSLHLHCHLCAQHSASLARTTAGPQAAFLHASQLLSQTCSLHWSKPMGSFQIQSVSLPCLNPFAGFLYYGG